MNDIELRIAVEPYTMASEERINKLIQLARSVIKDNIPGDMVECGVCNGGSAAILAHFAVPDGRKVHLFDSWQGLPPTTPEDTPSANGNTAESEVGKCVGDLKKVEEVMKAVGGLDGPGNVIIHEGWFEETFLRVKTAGYIDKIAMLNLDSDWYSSEKLCLETWYDKISPGGYIYLDDFFYWPGCQRAVKEYFHGMDCVFHQVGHSAWMKKGESGFAGPGMWIEGNRQ